jgi:hypothetical protein
MQQQQTIVITKQLMWQGPRSANVIWHGIGIGIVHMSVAMSIGLPINTCVRGQLEPERSVKEEKYSAGDGRAIIKKC